VFLSWGPFSSGQDPELNVKETPMFSTGVNLVSVPVVVRAPQGHAVGTLRKEDFQLFDQGKPQTISRFSIEKADAPATVAAVTQGASRESAAPGTTPATPPASRSPNLSQATPARRSTRPRV
jgi:hypothetical protein